jgi:NAD(P)-dependent dehydrogenase (short-subunit alcohol dehydrogenase family)
VGQNVVVIGGSTGMAEAGAHLYRQGRTVTVITRNRSLGHDLQGAHPNHALHAAVSEGFGPMGRYKDGFTVIEQASTTRLDPGKVTYQDKQGELREIVCDTIIANGGMQVEYNEICDLANASNRYFLVGDANSHHNLFQGIRDAFAAVNQL